MCVPLIKPIIQSDARTKYFLVLSFIFAFLFPELITLGKDFGNNAIISGAELFDNVINKMNMYMVLGYAGYFILGYYMNKINPDKLQRIVIYLLGLSGAVFTVVVNLKGALKTQTAFDHYYGYLNVNVMLEAVAVFVFFKYGKYGKDNLNVFMERLSKLSFGAYLVHVLIIELLDNQLGLNTLSFNPALAVISISVIVCVASFLVSAVLNKIPIVNRYMV